MKILKYYFLFVQFDGHLIKIFSFSFDLCILKSLKCFIFDMKLCEIKFYRKRSELIAKYGNISAEYG